MIKNKIYKKKYRPCVGIVLIKNGMIFAGKRLDYKSGAWQMPQGGIEKGEFALDAAIRELNEETGIKKKQVEIIAETKKWVSYDLPKKLVPKLWNGKFAGQKQKWFAMNFVGCDHDININTNFPEFSGWQWMTKEQLFDNVVPFKKKVYKFVLSEFTKIGLIT